MAELHIACLGDFQVTLDGAALTGFSTDKSRALLPYLALETRVHQRTELAQFLWPGYSDESARNSLRQTLHQLRQALRDGETEAWLLLTRQTVQINPAAPIRVDVTTFTQLLAACATHTHAAVANCAACLERLHQAVDLYRGDFLSGFTVDDSAPFEEWRRITQEQLHIQLLDALQLLATAAESRGDPDDVLRIAYRQLALEPWLEAAHRQIMRIQAGLGQRTAALAQYQRCRQVLAAELGVEPDAETTALYEQIRSGQAVAPRLTTPAAAPVVAPVADPAPPPVDQPDLPGKPTIWSAQLPPLLGRTAELAQITNLLEQPSCRLVTLVGPPGVGKTRLAQAVLAASPWNQNGYFIELAALRDPTLLATTIAHALTTAHPTLQFTGDRLIEGLRDQDILLVLDNFEQVLPGVELVGQLLVHCPALKLLVTSRAPLRSGGEQVVTVYPLPLPELTGGITVASVAQNGAVQLFCQRAAAVAPGFVLTDRLAPVVVEICRRLDGLPLAIELAAAHSRLLSPPALLERLTQRLLLLTSRSQDRPERQQTLRAAIAWSYELLNAAEQRLFRQLAVFAGGATLSAIEAVIGNDREALAALSTDRSLLAGLEALLDKSLLRQVEVPYAWGEGEPRVLMLETLREYGWELLGTAEANDASTPQRHAEYFLTLAESAAPKLHGPDQVEWLDRLTLDHDNLRAALTWFDQAGEVRKALRLATALRYFWRVRGHYREGSERLLQLLAQPEAAPSGGPSDAVRARALNAAGYLLWVQGDTATAQQLLQEALNLGRAVADAAATAFALRYLGLAAATRQEQATARQLLEESLAIYRRLDMPNETASALMYLGDAAFGQQAYDEAQRLYQESADLLRQAGNNVVLPYALRHLGYLALARGKLKAALSLATESLRLNLAAGEQQGSAAALTALAAVAVAGERWQQGARLLDCVAGWLADSRAQLLPLDRTYYEQTQRLLQQQLQGGTLGAFAAVTERLSLEQALAYIQQEPAFADLPELTAPPADRGTSRPEVGAHEARSVTELPSPPVAPLPNPSVPQSPLYNLPAALPPLIGRERELVEIVSRLRQPGARLLTLAGPGGMGKTRLALAAAAQVAPHFVAGVCLVELAELTEPRLLPQAVAAALGQTEPAEAGGADPIARYVGDKPLLLVLDNCEHVAEAAADWSKRWLSACPRLCILATSHGALALAGEVVWPIPTLAYPPPTELEADQLLAFAAVQLFVRRAQEVKADFALTAANGSAVAEICRRLEGIPLALELAAARVRSLTPTEIALRLNKGIDTALANNRRAPARHQTMQAALDWSFAALDADEQLLFQQLAVFAGGFTLSAVESVTQLPDALDLLERLIDRALIITETLAEESRYRLLGIIRKYAADKLSASSLAPALRQRHVLYFLQLAESAEMDIQADGEALWLQPDAENFSSALDWALANAAHGSAVRLAGALTWYWWIRGYLRTQRTPLQQALAHLESAQQQPAPARPDDLHEPALRALAAGALLALWEEPDKARLAFTQALALAEAAPNQQLIGLALRRLAAVAIQQQAYEAANEFIERGLVVWQALGGIWHVAWLYALQGDLANQREDHDQAWLAYEASSRLPVDPGARAYPLRRMAYLALARGERSQALALCRESLQLNRATGDRQGIAACLVGVAHFTVAGAQTAPQTARLPLLRRAAELLGAVDALLQTVEGRLLQVDEAAYQQTAHSLQEQLAVVAPESYQAALAVGRALTVEQATALALQEEVILPAVEPLRQQETPGSPVDSVTELVEVTESPNHPVRLSSGVHWAQSLTQSPLLDWAEMPVVDFFVERQAEVAQLTTWLIPSTAGGVPVQLISILGIGGMGKTTLAAMVTKAVAPAFAVVIWRSLLNAPPLSELLRGWLQTLSRQTLTAFPASLDEQLRLLLTYLQQERCLLVLDNVESIFAPDSPSGSSQSRAGVVRPGYEGYDQLLQRLASSEHQSCLLLTSREQPYALLRAGRQAQAAGRVQVLPLAGLDPQAGFVLLQNNGLHTTTAAEAAQLVENYSGNPLALQIVAATIADFFGGDVAAFQQEEGALFDGMRLVLDQQFARLSPLERDILIWLAIEREPTTVPTLRANLVQPVATASLLEALQALQNRSLLEKRDTGLTLQNVIIEYTTEYLVNQVCQEIAESAERGVQNADYSALNRFALLKAQAKEYVRQSQARLILQPVAQQLVSRWGQSTLLTRSQELLELLRKQAPRTPGYAAGNLLNLLLSLGIDLNDYDFSNLCVWQPYLREKTLPQFNFTNADLRGAAFTDTFDIVRALAYSPDGHLLAAGTSDGEIRLWRATDGQLLANMKGHGDIVGWLGFLDDGKTLLSYSHDLALAVWQVGPLGADVASGEVGEMVTLRLLYRNSELNNLTNLVAFHPRNELLAFGTERGWLCLWHLGARRQLSEQTLNVGQLHTLCFSPDGKTLALGASDRRVYLWAVDGSAGRLALRQTLAETPAVARDFSFHPDGRTLVSGHEDGSIYLWALDAAGYCATGQATQVLSGHQAGVWRLVFSPDGQLLASSSDDHSVWLWEIKLLPASVSAQPVARFDDHRGWVRALAFSPDGRALASAGADRTIRVWDLRRAQLLYTLYGYVRAVKSIAFCPNSRLLVSGSDDQRVRLWDATSSRCLQTWAGHTSFIWQVAVSPDGRLIASAGDDGQIYVRDIGSGQVLKILSGHDSGVTAVAFSHDSRLLASGGIDSRVFLWDVRAPWPPASGRDAPIRTWDAATQVVWTVVFSPNGEYLAFGGEPNRVRLWHLPTQQFLPSLANETGVLRSLAFSPDSTWLAAAGHDAIVYLWRVGRAAPPILLRGHQHRLRSVAFSPDGQRLATASFDQTVRLWDLHNQTQIRTLQGHSNQVLAVAFSTDGTLLASASEDETIRLWHGKTGEPLAVLPMPGPYNGMKIDGVTGISAAQKVALKALGAVEDDKVTSDKVTSDKVTSDKVTELVEVTESPPHLVTQSPGHLVTGSPLLDWAEMPMVDFFVERRAEVAQLTAWLTPPTAGGVPAQLISILGMGGMGKTTLAAMVTKAVAPAFAVVIWRSLLNAPPLDELLRSWLQTLSRQTLTALPASLDEQLRLLLTYLQQERCLLVLDNVESIFVADTPATEGTSQPQSRAGVTRPGYEGYDQLLQRLASSDHQSCLLLTSREQPYALLRIATGRRGQAQAAGRVQVLPLAGLDPQAGFALLQNNGLHTTAAEAAQLVENYSGNPLALQIVAATIADFFGGDVAAFQQEEGALFDGMRLVLDQQFARLSPLERDILIWLAIEREPTTVPTLRANLVQPIPTNELLAALQALQNRSLLEKREGGLTLQNVVIEYTTEYLVEQVCQEITESTEFGIRYAEYSGSPSGPRIPNFALNCFALLKAQAKQYVRQSQARLLLQPVADRLVSTMGRAQLIARIPQLLDTLRAAGVQKGYAGGNLLNLLVQLGEELIGYDFSHLPVWQANLSGLTFVTANFTGADLGRSTFTAGITVDRVAFQPTGELWVAGLQNGVLGLWRTVAGQLTHAFQHAGNLRGPLAFSPDGRFIAADTEDGHIHVWSTTTGECLQRLEQHQSTLYTLAFSEDGTRLASCSSGRLVRLWDLHTGRCYQRLPGYDQGADALAFSPDGQLLATGGGDGLIQLWDARSTDEAGHRIAVWQAHRQPLGALAFSPNGRWLASGSHSGEVQLWELAPISAEQSQASAGHEVAARPYRAGPSCQGHTSIIRVFRFVPTSDPAGYLLASAGADRTVRIWSITGQLRYTLLGHTNVIYSLSISPDGQQLASAGTDKQIILWDIATGQALYTQQAHRSALHCLAFSPDGQLLACGGADPIVRLWSVATDTQPSVPAVQAPEPSVGQPPVGVSQIRHFLRGHAHFLCSVAFSPDGQTVASGDADRTLRLWDRTTGQALQTLHEHQGSVRALAFAPTQSRSPQGEALLASAGADRIIRLWSVATQQSRQIQGRRQLVGHEDEILALAFDRRERHLVSGCADGSLRIWDVQRGVTLHQLTGHTAPVTTVAIHPTDNIIASSCFDQTIRLWDLTSGACLQVVRGAQIGTSTLAFSPDGQYLAYAGNDFVIYLWPWRTGTVTPFLPSTPLRGHMGRVYALSFSPTTTRLASCSTDGTIRLWDVASKSCSQILRPPGPYTGMKITGVTGISEAQKAALKALGAVEETVLNQAAAL